MHCDHLEFCRHCRRKMYSLIEQAMKAECKGREYKPEYGGMLLCEYKDKHDGSHGATVTNNAGYKMIWGWYTSGQIAYRYADRDHDQ